MKINTAHLYLFLLLGFPVFAQEEMLLQGKIEADSLNGSFINIVNLTQETGTTNAADGSFEIGVKENDTLLFSSVQFELLQVKISRQILEERFLRVRLKPKLNELSEVQLTNHNLSGNLASDLGDIEVFDQGAVGFPQKNRRKLSEVERVHRSMTISGLAVLVNTLNGKLKRLERASKVIDLDQLVDQGIEAVPAAFFTSELQIPEKQILNFVHHCMRMDGFKKLVAQKEFLEIIEFYYQQAPPFLEQLKHEKNPFDDEKRN